MSVSGIKTNDFPYICTCHIAGELLRISLYSRTSSGDIYICTNVWAVMRMLLRTVEHRFSVCLCVCVYVCVYCMCFLARVAINSLSSHRLRPFWSP